MRQSKRFLSPLPVLLRNDEGKYEGNLVDYFRIIFLKATNLGNGYHNFRHLMHVMCRCYEACLYYEDVLSPREMRNLLIAAMFHDFNHTGKSGPDSVNIHRAVAGFIGHIRPEDSSPDDMDEILSLIHATEYPYTVESEKLPLSAQILRDADLSQAIDPAWMQQTIFGFSGEWQKTPFEVLRGQVAFHSNLVFITEWARERFPQSEIDAKVAEAREFYELVAGDGALV